jgi:lysophospholipase
MIGDSASLVQELLYLMSSPLPLLVEKFEGARAGFFELQDKKRLRYAIFDPVGAAHDTVLITPGRREFIEKKYAEMGPEFLARGFRLIFVEWRGQGLSSRYFEDDKRQRDHATDFTQHIDDLNHFYDAVVLPNLIGKLIIHGHSMGGHFLLRWLVERQNTAVAGAFLTAPMLALAGPAAHASASFLSWGSSKLGYGEDYAPMQHDFNDEDRAFAGNPLTHDPDRFPIIEKYFSAYPDLTVGGVTWDWMQAAIKSMYGAQRRFRLERIAVPVLAIVGNEDRVTPPDEIIRYLKMIPKAETILIPGSRHDVMNEISPCRDEAWRQIDGFLKKII